MCFRFISGATEREGEGVRGITSINDISNVAHVERKRTPTHPERDTHKQHIYSAPPPALVTSPSPPSKVVISHSPCTCRITMPTTSTHSPVHSHIHRTLVPTHLDQCHRTPTHVTSHCPSVRAPVASVVSTSTTVPTRVVNFCTPVAVETVITTKMVNTVKRYVQRKVSHRSLVSIPTSSNCRVHSHSRRARVVRSFHDTSSTLKVNSASNSSTAVAVEMKITSTRVLTVSRRATESHS